MQENLAVEPIRVPAWAWLVAAAAAFVVAAVSVDSTALLAGAADDLHELFHDARHFIGVPCH